MGLVSQIRSLYEKIYRTVQILLQRLINSKGHDHISRYTLNGVS